MENLRRNIKMFFAQYSSLIFIIVSVILGILLILKFLDGLAENNYKKRKLEIEKSSINSNVVQNVETKKMEKARKQQALQDKKIINNFISLCQENEEEAYNMLSSSCKTDKYPTFEIFKNNYLNVIFSQNRVYKTEDRDYKIEEQEQYNLYKVLFYVEDILQAGSVENRKRYENLYYIEQNSQNVKKIYIDY